MYINRIFLILTAASTLLMPISVSAMSNPILITQKPDEALTIGYAGSGVQNGTSIKEGVLGAVRDFAEPCVDAKKIICVTNPTDPICTAFSKDELTSISVVEARGAAQCIASIWAFGSDSLAATIYSAVNRAGIVVGVVGFLDSPSKQYDIYAESVLIRKNDKPEFFYNQTSGKSFSETSNRAPAYVDFNGRMYMAFVDPDYKLKISSRQVGDTPQFGWNIPKQINSHKSGDKPSLAVFNNQLYVAFKGSGSNAIYISRSSDGVSWSAAKRINSHQSAYSPTLAVVKVNGADHLVAGFRGSSSKRLYFTHTVDGTNWISAVKNSEQSSNAPYLAEHNGALFAAFKGASTRDLYVMKSTDAGMSWTNAISLSNRYRSNRAPAIASHNGKLYMVFKGISTNNIYWTYSVDGLNSFTAPVAYLHDSVSGVSNKTSGSLTLYSSGLF
ncbi:hypothetical protein HUF18_12000 [Thalassolituus sp. ST750PaO-4]|uniref:hypothetical protein n=1 Tax=Thalassolituus sp. ST750PaO-4 TaxID=2742965 RepID=UPI000C542DE8|nr:hypothetical protein [Thalassolituus sp. ST750PaO-4]MCA6060503.1 hypothetical protein [Thalassolituus sp. ST750PaO-4]PIQ38853.1 MAG: hypothetical protein COW58_15075 [Thalassolituus sp. CG17_big_fil_post_rev_8_21_14_2_50_53_8]